MPASPTVLYLTPGVFDKGGVSRYGRYQVRALRELLGEKAITVLSVLPPDGRGFETPFAVDLASFGTTPRGKVVFAGATLAAALSDRPDVVWSGHLHLAPLSVFAASLVGAASVLNVYGAEVRAELTGRRRRALERSRWVVSDCHATLDELVARGLRSRDRTCVHWDCVDLERFGPGDPGEVLARYGVPPVRGDVFTVLTLARLAAHEGYKGVDRLIDTFAALPADLPVRLVIAGDGDERSSLQQRAEDQGQASRVHFTGFVDEADLVPLYRACDAFSLITHSGPGSGEGIPLTPLEAAACGKPILVGDQDGSREAAEDGVSGFVLDPFDLAAHGDRIRRLVTDPALRRRMGQAARERIRAEHGYERFKSRIGDLLPELT